MASSDFKKLLQGAGLAELGPGPRDGVMNEAALNKVLDALLRQSAIPSNSRELVRGLILLWHDHLDAAHAIGQGIESVDGSFLHGIVHRREPDYGNAEYWFRRVGPHKTFPEITKRVKELLAETNETALVNELIPRGHWDPVAMIHCCERVAGKPITHRETELLCKIQRIETEVLLEYFTLSPVP